MSCQCHWWTDCPANIGVNPRWLKTFNQNSTQAVLTELAFYHFYKEDFRSRSYWVHIFSHLMTRPTNWPVRPAKTQISLGIRPVWSESSLCAEWVAKDPSFHHADSEDSDQTWQMPRLIWVFAGRTCHFVGFVMRRPFCTFSFAFSLRDVYLCNTVLRERLVASSECFLVLIVLKLPC